MDRGVHKTVYEDKGDEARLTAREADKALPLPENA
jgi:hypothetical protein